jgi:predicted nuclease of restriction endonuclease-like (RecB) superfamily
MISEKTEQSIWGDKILQQVSKDLKYEFPNMKGLSRTNLAFAKQFFKFYQSSIVQQAVGQLQIFSDLSNKITQHPVMQIYWGHNILIFSKANDVNESYYRL